MAFIIWEVISLILLISAPSQLRDWILNLFKFLHKREQELQRLHHVLTADGFPDLSFLAE